MDLLVLRDLDPHLVTRKYARVLEQLRQGDFRSAEVKKLRDSTGGGVYRARLDDKDRLLFKLGEHDGRTYLLVLEVVRNHDYAKARFLNGGSYTEDDFEAVASPAAHPPERMTYVNPASPAFHVLDKALSFDAAQTAVFEAPLPLIVIGSAGSGKTALTLEKLKTIPGHGLYLTRSAYLVDNARSLYYANGYANDGQEVEFLSLLELVETIHVPAGRAATGADFRSWYTRMRQFRLKEPHRIYEEIHGVITGTPGEGPWLSETEYLELGIRQSIFLGEERRAVYQVFERWRDHLREAGLYDANVAATERRGRARPTYDFLVVDEVQDITLVELRLALVTLKDRRQFVLCGDSNQIVHPNLFSWARVKGLFYDEAAATLDRIHVLHANYRNTQAVTALANRLLLVKQRRFGSIDRESNYLVDTVSGDPGQVDLVVDDPQVRAEIEAKTHRSTRYAVVVLRDEDKLAARAAFSTPLVFSVQEAKGLEYENVILFNLVGSAAEEFAACTDGVEEGPGGALVYARARDKTDKSLDAYKFYVNALYVAMTRAVRSLLLVERDPAHPLWELLALKRKDERVELAADESSREEWQREARRLELQGKTEQAEQIRREILETEPVPWPVMDAATVYDVQARALAPGSRDKEAQQLLYEYALTYDVADLAPALVDAGFRHARNPESGRTYIETTHYADYRLKRPQTVLARIRKHGVDFRNPLNETPLMVAARVGRGDLVRDLLAQGADPELTDTAGRTPFRVLLAGFMDGQAGKRIDLSEAFQALADRPLKVRVRGRMSKLDPRSMEWFLLHFALVLYRRLICEDLADGLLPAFQAPLIAEWLATFPSRVLPDRRKQRAYISSVLARNEVRGTSPYNRRLFFRVGHGSYVVNPILEIEVKGEWVDAYELMNIALLLQGLASPANVYSFVQWRGEARHRLPQELDAEERADAVPPT